MTADVALRYFLFTLLSLYAQPNHADSPQTSCNKHRAAQIESLQGTVWYDADGSGNWLKTTLNQEICEGSRIKVDAYSRASLTLINGVILRLDAGTIMNLKGIAKDKPALLDLMKGFVHFISRTPRRMEITTPIASAGPEGTEFALKATDDKTDVWVYEGAVKFFNRSGKVYLKPGESAEALLGQSPRAQIDLSPNDAVKWALYYPPLIGYSPNQGQVGPKLVQALSNYRQGHIDTALKSLEELSISSDPSAIRLRAALRLSVGRSELAMQDVQNLLVINPQDAYALALKAIMALTQNRKFEAFDLAKQAVGADAKSAAAYSALSYVEQANFNLDQALSAARQASQLANHDALTWARLAELYLSLGQVDQSETAVKQAIKLDADLERSQSIMGFYHLLKTESSQARPYFEKAIRLDSSAPLARLGLGLSKIRDGELEEGRRDLELAAILDPNNALIRSYLGKAYYEERRSPLADEQFRLAKQHDPKDPTAYFYDAINKQTTNRPGEALQTMQEAIALNGNRAVYRSKFQLDQDEAARQVGLGRIFTNLGFDDPAHRQAVKSLASDPSNYSAHRLLSDSYVNRPRHEIARASEFLQSQLLQSLNYNPIQPSLAYTDLNLIRGSGPNDSAFNEYNHLFERNGIKFSSTGIAGSNSTYGDEAALSGIYKKFSFSLGQFHYQTDGFRQNNDLRHNLYNVFAQYEISPAWNIQAEFRHRETEHGDLEMKGDLNHFAPTNRRSLDSDSYRLGMKLSPNDHSNLLFSFIYALRNEVQNRYTLTPPIPQSPFPDGLELFTKDKTHNQGLQLESQYLLHHDQYDLVIGAGDYDFDVSNESQVRPCPVGLPFCPTPDPETTEFNRNQRFGYAYSSIRILDNLSTTLGLAYDNYADNKSNEIFKISQLSPKFGLNWKFNDSLNFRLAAFQSIKTPIIVNQVLQPTQIAGFNQFFDDLNGTRSTQYGVGMDAHLLSSWYSGLEAYKRDLDVPNINVLEKREEELYRIYSNWLITENWSLTKELRFEDNHGQGQVQFRPETLKTASIPVNLKFFHPSGFFANVGGTYINQKVRTSESDYSNFDSSFFLMDASIGYRLPKQYGLISFEARNLLDKEFKYRDRNFQMNEQRTSDYIPERMLFGRITLNF